MEILSDKMVKTRKPHQCFGCGRTRPKGTNMHCQVNAGDDGIYTVYNCDVCWSIMSKYGDDEGMIDDWERTYYHECVHIAMEDYKVETPEELLVMLGKKYTPSGIEDTF